jgi:hypothetical protein
MVGGGGANLRGSRGARSKERKKKCNSWDNCEPDQESIHAARGTPFFSHKFVDLLVIEDHAWPTKPALCRSWGAEKQPKNPSGRTF